MRVLVSALVLLVGPASLLAQGRSELEMLRARCLEQERQIRTLEDEIKSLHSQLALERRRSRGVSPAAETPARPDATGPSAAETYTVASGDTLSSIARRYRTSADLLMKNNGIEDPTRLRVGQKLVLPVTAHLPAETSSPHASSSPSSDQQKDSAVAETSSPKATKPKQKTYEVQRGDTLYGVARQHKISVSDLRSLNPDVQDKIDIGQKLVVAGDPVGPGGASLQTISTQTSAPEATLSPAAPPSQKAPPAASADVPSQPVTNSTTDTAPTEQSSTNSAPEAAAKTPQTVSTITVMDEITFGDFAQKHGTTPDQLNALNGWDFKSNLVLARGSEIYVPGQ